MNKDLDNIFYSNLNRTSLDELNRLGEIQKGLAKEIAQLKEQMSEIKNVKFIELNDVKSLIKFEPHIDFDKIKTADFLNKIPLVN